MPWVKNVVVLSLVVIAAVGVIGGICNRMPLAVSWLGSGKTTGTTDRLSQIKLVALSPLRELHRFLAHYLSLRDTSDATIFHHVGKLKVREKNSYEGDFFGNHNRV